MRELPPEDFGVRLDPDVLVRDGERLLCGGTPYKLTRLSAAGAERVARWRRGGPVGRGVATRRLAAKLLDAGVLVADPAPRAVGAGEVVVAVPTHDRAHDLARCLTEVARLNPDIALVVVDDASEDAAAIRAVADRFGARVVRLDRNRGAAGARNAGLAATTEPLIAFVDSDVVVCDGWLERLVAHFDDPAAGAVAPRVLALEDGPGVLARYEAARSSLDMGTRAGSVGIGRRVPYIPSATLVVRREAVPGGFDETLTIGEDVDFVWRMANDGWRVTYDPAASVRHDHRVRPGAFVRRRFTYAFSIGPLARRHPDALPALRTDRTMAVILLLVATRRVAPAALLLGFRTLRLRRALQGHADHPTLLAAELSGHATLGAARGAGHAVRRAWSPLLLVAATRSRAARALLATGWALQCLDHDAPSPRHLPVTALDDVLAGVGTWFACIHQRTLRPLLPARAVLPRRKPGAS